MPERFEAHRCPYVVLGVRPYSSIDAQRIAYHRLARRHHPDAGGRPEDFRDLQQAWDQVRDVGFRLAHARRSVCECGGVGARTTDPPGSARTTEPAGTTGPVVQPRRGDAATQTSRPRQGSGAGPLGRWVARVSRRIRATTFLHPRDVLILAVAALVCMVANFDVIAVIDGAACLLVVVMLGCGYTRGPWAAMTKGGAALVVFPAAIYVMIVGAIIAALLLVIVVVIVIWVCLA